MNSFNIAMSVITLAAILLVGAMWLSHRLRARARIAEAVKTMRLTEGREAAAVAERIVAGPRRGILRR